VWHLHLDNVGNCKFLHGSGARGCPRRFIALIHGQWMPHKRSDAAKQHRIDRGQACREGDPEPEPPPLRRVLKRPARVGAPAPEVEEAADPLGQDFLGYRRPAGVGSTAQLATREELDPPPSWRRSVSACTRRSVSPAPPSPKRRRTVHDLDPDLLRPFAQQAATSSASGVGTTAPEQTLPEPAAVPVPIGDWIADIQARPKAAPKLKGTQQERAKALIADCAAREAAREEEEEILFSALIADCEARMAAKEESEETKPKLDFGWGPWVKVTNIAIVAPVTPPFQDERGSSAFNAGSTAASSGGPVSGPAAEPAGPAAAADADPDARPAAGSPDKSSSGRKGSSHSAGKHAASRFQ
jgi:hypothetical protein